LFLWRLAPGDDVDRRGLLFLGGRGLMVEEEEEEEEAVFISVVNTNLRSTSMA